MTLQPQPSPYRCETCKVPKNVTKPVWCLVAGKWIYPGIPEYDLSEKYGLCCHSSAGSESAMLDKIKQWMRTHCYWYYVNGHEGEKRYHFEPAKFDEFLEELRQQQTKERER